MTVLRKAGKAALAAVAAVAVFLVFCLVIAGLIFALDILSHGT